MKELSLLKERSLRKMLIIICVLFEFYFVYNIFFVIPNITSSVLDGSLESIKSEATLLSIIFLVINPILFFLKIVREVAGVVGEQKAKQ